MASARFFLAAAAFTAVAQAASLADVCTTAWATSALPEAGFYNGITIDTSSVVVSAGYNFSATNDMFPDTTVDYCSVQFAYTHDGTGDQVLVLYWMPAPDSFANRFLATGGGGLAINSGTTSLPGGVSYGAASGETDGGFGSFDTQYDAVSLLANGTLNKDSLYMFGYEAIHEMTVLGKEFTKNFFSMGDAKLYTYYQACSEGGREGWSQVQRFGDELDGAIIGAPAFRYGHQQVLHLFGNAIINDIGYTPPPCELSAIVNATIAACDGLDGKEDGVVGRTDLCLLDFDLSSTIGTPYYCAATAASAMSGAAAPAQNGTVTELGVAVAQRVVDGMFDSDGKRVYLSFQISSTFHDESASWDEETQSWVLSVNGLGGEWVERWLYLLNGTDLDASLSENITYDTLRDWMYWGWQKYEDVLQTTWPDLTPYYEGGGKILHFHGESDDSVPTASSVHYHEAVRNIMYPDLSFNESTAALQDWYQLYLVPGGAHCAPSDLQPDGPWPQTNLAVMIDWVEKNNTPTTLNATHLAGDNIGANEQICQWPLRPYWVGNATNPECVYDQDSIDSWMYNFDAFKEPVY